MPRYGLGHYVSIVLAYVLSVRKNYAYVLGLIYLPCLKKTGYAYLYNYVSSSKKSNSINQWRI